MGKIGRTSLEKVEALKIDFELQRSPTLRENVLDVKKIMKKGRYVHLKHDPLSMIDVYAGMDRLGRYIFEIPDKEQHYNLLSTLLRPLTLLTDNGLDFPESERFITAVFALYHTVEQDKQKVSVPTHWFCETVVETKKQL